MNNIAIRANTFKSINIKPKQDSLKPSVLEQKSNSCCSAMQLNNNKDLVNFTGLNRVLSKNTYEYTINIEELSEIYPKSNGIVGNLPPAWIAKIPKENREKVIKELFNDLKPIINEFRESENEQFMQERIKTALIQAGIVKNQENFKMEFLGEGTYGKAYKLNNILGADYIIKIFKKLNKNLDKGLDDMHGNYIEQSRALYWQKQAGFNTQMIRFYFGDIDAGYMVNKFIDEDTPKSDKFVYPEIVGLHSSDIGKEYNEINGTQYDWGGFRIIISSQRIKDKKIKKLIKDILEKSVNQRKEIFEQYFTSTDKGIKLVLSSMIEYLPEHQRARYFHNLLENADSEVKNALAARIYNLPEEERTSCFRELLENPSNGSVENLAYGIYCLPLKETAACFKLLAKNPSNRAKAALINRIYCLPEEERGFYFDQFLKESDIKVKKTIVENITCLPQKERLFYFYQLLKNADANLKKVLAFNIDCLQDEERTACFRKLAKNANSEIKQILADRICYLPKEDRQEVQNLVS